MPHLSTQLVTIITALGGLVVPPIVSLLKKESWSAQVKQLIAGLVSLLIAAVAVYFVAPSDFGLPFASLAGLVYAGSQVVYGGWFKNSAVDVALTSVFNKKPAA